MTQSPFVDVPLAPADPILGLTDAFVADKNPKKVNLGVGVYQDAGGKVPVVSVAREAEKALVRQPIDGVPAYRKEQMQHHYSTMSPDEQRSSIAKVIVFGTGGPVSSASGPLTGPLGSEGGPQKEKTG